MLDLSLFELLMGCKRIHDNESREKMEREITQARKYGCSREEYENLRLTVLTIIHDEETVRKNEEAEQESCSYRRRR